MTFADKVIDTPEPKVKRVLVVGTGESTIKLLNKSIELDPDIITIGFHRAFPYLNTNSNIKLDYWTWRDPHAVYEGLQYYQKLDDHKKPKILVPYWMLDLKYYVKNWGSSPITRSSDKVRSNYVKTLNDINSKNFLISIQNSVSLRLLSTKHEIYSNPSERFSGNNVYFGTNPFNIPKKGQPYENPLSQVVLPLCYYLGANEVYSIGFDNQGVRIDSKTPVTFNDDVKRKIKMWTEDWQPYHKMKIYNLSPPEFSPNHTFMETVSIDNLLNK